MENEPIGHGCDARVPPGQKLPGVQRAQKFQGPAAAVPGGHGRVESRSECQTCQALRTMRLPDMTYTQCCQSTSYSSRLGTHWASQTRPDRQIRACCTQYPQSSLQGSRTSQDKTCNWSCPRRYKSLVDTWRQGRSRREPLMTKNHLHKTIQMGRVLGQRSWRDSGNHWGTASKAHSPNNPRTRFQQRKKYCWRRL